MTDIPTSPWHDDDTPFDLADAEELAAYDVEHGIAALRRNYAIARLSGWPETAALRIAIKTVMDIVDEDTRPKLQVVK